MYRGETPTLVYHLKDTTLMNDTTLDLTTLTQIWVTIDDGQTKRTWDISDVSIDNEHKNINLFLTQEETLAFKSGMARTQIRMLTSSGAAITTNIKTIDVNTILKGGVIS